MFTQQWCGEITCSSSAYGAGVKVKARLLRDSSTGAGGGLHPSCSPEPIFAEVTALTSCFSSTPAFSSNAKAS